LASSKFTNSPIHQFDNNHLSMIEIGVIGAGELGGAIAHVLAQRDVAG
jgi:phosphoglycerate dehydrogenase-like enzyme